MLYSKFLAENRYWLLVVFGISQTFRTPEFSEAAWKVNIAMGILTYFCMKCAQNVVLMVGPKDNINQYLLNSKSLL